MKKYFIFLIVLLVVNVSVSFPVYADPRMETNKNFCHFILDTANTDNEVFVAGCDSMITVVEKIPPSGNTKAKCEEDNYIAKGYAIVVKDIPAAANPLTVGVTSLTFSSAQTDEVCTMVESNGRAYKSKKWQSSIKVVEKRNGSLKIRFELFCEEGQQ